VQDCLQELPGHQGFASFAAEVGADLRTGCWRRAPRRKRLAGVAEVMLATGTSGGGSPSLTALTFAAAAARAAWDTRRARGLLDEALAAADDPDTRVDITEHLRASGRVADAIELLEERLRKAPDDENAAAWRARKFTGT
jgi:tetratricopeptide (TPR) repeat protein